MEFRYIGRTGLRVSPICLGTMTFGGVIDKQEAFAVMDRAYAAGINFFDSAELKVRHMAARFLNNKTLAFTARYMEIAANLSLSPAMLAIAWSKQFDFVASTIVGANSCAQLDESLAAMERVLSEETLARCEQVHSDILYPMG